MLRSGPRRELTPNGLPDPKISVLYASPLILNIEIISSTHMTIKMSDFAILAMFLFSFYKAHLYIQNLKRALLQNISTFVERFTSISEMIDMTSTKAYPDKIKYTSVLPKYNTT